MIENILPKNTMLMTHEQYLEWIHPQFLSFYEWIYNNHAKLYDDEDTNNIIQHDKDIDVDKIQEVGKKTKAILKSYNINTRMDILKIAKTSDLYKTLKQKIQRFDKVYNNAQQYKKYNQKCVLCPS